VHFTFGRGHRSKASSSREVEFDGPPSLYPVVGRGRQKVAKFDPVCSLAWRYIAWSSWHNVRDSARFSCRYLRLLVSKSVHTVQWSGVFGHAHSSGNMLRVAEVRVPLSRLWLLESRTFRNPALTSFAFAIVVTEGSSNKVRAGFYLFLAPPFFVVAPRV
jgi:hypothetical protein